MEGKMYGIDTKKLLEFKQLMCTRRKMDFGCTVSTSLHYGDHVPGKVPKKTTLTFVSAGAKININYLDSTEKHQISLEKMCAIQKLDRKVIIEFKDCDLKILEIYFKDEETTNKFLKLMPPVARPTPAFESLDFSESSSDGSMGRGGTIHSSIEDVALISSEDD